MSAGHDAQLVSVIVPVYQVKHHLRRCLDSIQEQTHKHLEIIVVDDGSTDGSSAICDEYAAADSRFVVIHQENRGLSMARNRGIEAARGEWITFVDSDDWIHQDAIRRMLASATPTSDVCVANYIRVSGTETPPDPPSTPPKSLSKSEMWDAFFGDLHVLLTIACGKLYRTGLFDGIRFPPGRLHEDEFTTFRVLGSGRDTILINEPLYYYYNNPNSITGSGLTPRHRLDIAAAFREQAAYIDSTEYHYLAPTAYSRLLRKQVQLHRSLSDAGAQQSANSVLLDAQATLGRIPSRMGFYRVRLFGRLFISFPRLSHRLLDMRGRRGGRGGVRSMECSPRR